MKQLILLTLLITVAMSPLSGQTIVADTISYVKKNSSYRFYQNDRWLTRNQLEEILGDDAQAYQQIRSATPLLTATTVISFTGGVFIGAPIGRALGSGSDPEWGWVGVGACLVAVSIPINHAYNRKVREAVETYNRGLQSTSLREKNEWRWHLAPQGVGLVCSFSKR